MKHRMDVLHGIPLGRTKNGRAKPTATARHPALTPLLVSDALIVISESRLKSAGWADLVRCASAWGTLWQLQKTVAAGSTGISVVFHGCGVW